MGLQGKETQVTARHTADIEDALDALVAELGIIEGEEGEAIGAVPRELAAKVGLSENAVQRWLRKKIVEGRADCALGWRMSPVTKRQHRVYVYWLKKGEDEHA